MRDILGELTPVEQKLAPSVLNVAGDVDLLRTSPRVARMNREHLCRYIAEFAGRFNHRPHDTLDQMAAVARGLFGRRLRCRELGG